MHLKTTNSTQDVARRLAFEGAPHGTVVTTDEQTQGYGRHGRRWFTEPNQTLVASVVLRTPSPLVPLVAGVAAATVLGRRAWLKWPNDVVFRSDDDEVVLSKVAGVLCESRPQQGWWVVGFGINVAGLPAGLPPEVARAADSMGMKPGDDARVLEELLVGLEDTLRLSEAEILAAWTERDVLRGRAVTWSEPDGSNAAGIAAGIDAQGRLVVELDTGHQRTLEASEVRLVRRR